VGIRRNIRLRLSHNVTSPAVCGLFNPVILIPKTLLEQISRDKLRAVLIHELAHIKRGDLWINCIQTFLQIAYFYNPFVWLVNLIVRRIREQAVDEMALVTLGDAAKSYSDTLIDIAEMAFSRPALSLRLVGVVESKKALSQRIKHILYRPFPKSAKLGILGLLTVIIAAAVLLPMAKAYKVTDLRGLYEKAVVSENYKAKVGPTDFSANTVVRWKRDGGVIITNPANTAVLSVPFKIPDYSRQAAWMDVAQVYMSPGIEKYEAIELRVFDHKKRELLSYEDYIGIGYSIRNSVATIYSIGQLLPDELDIWMRVIHKPADTKIIRLPARQNAVANLEDNTLKILEIKKGAYSYSSEPSGVNWTKHNSEYDKTATSVAFQFDEKDNNRKKFQICAVSKDGQRFVPDYPHFISSANGRIHVIEIGFPLEQLGHFEITPFISRDTFYFDDIKLPKVSGLFAPCPEVTFDINGSEDEFRNNTLSPVELKLFAFSKKRVSEVSGSPDNWRNTFKTFQAKDGSSGFALKINGVRTKDFQLSYFDQSGRKIDPGGNRSKNRASGGSTTIIADSFNVPLKQIHSVKLQMNNEKINKQMPLPELIAHKYYKVGDPIQIYAGSGKGSGEWKPTLEEIYSDDDTNAVFFLIDGEEYDSRIGFGPFGGGSMGLHIQDELYVSEDDFELSVGRHTIAYGWRNVDVTSPDEPEKPVHFDRLLTEEVEFEVVDEIPDDYYSEIYDEGWEEILANNVEVRFTDDIQKHRVAGTLLTLSIKSLPFDIAFEIYAQAEGSDQREFAARVARQANSVLITIPCDHNLESLNWDSVGQKRYRLILVPSIEVARANPPVRHYYGREFITDWAKFEKSDLFEQHYQSYLERRERDKIPRFGGTIKADKPVDLDRLSRRWRGETPEAWPLPDGFELGWSPENGGTLRIDPDSNVKMHWFPEANASRVDPDKKTKERLVELPDSRTTEINPPKGERTLIAIRSNEGKVYFVTVSKVNEQWANLSWWPTEDSIRGNVKATLPNGVTVELVGMCREPLNNAQWWKPDGSEMYEPLFEASRRASPMQAIPTRYVFLAKAYGGENVSTRMKIYEGFGWSTKVARDGTALCYVKQPDNSSTHHKDAFEKGPVEIGVAQGQWIKGRGVSSPNMQIHRSYLIGNNDQVVIQPPQAEKSSPDMATIFWATTSSKDYEYRLNCTLKDGSVEQCMEPFFQSTGVIETGGLSNGKLHTISFNIDKPLEQIVNYELLYRKFEYARFNNVAFKPGLKTDVQVAVEKRAGQAEVGIRRMYLPDLETPDVNVVLDLATGQMLSAKQMDRDGQYFEKLGKGDLVYEYAANRSGLMCLRGARMELLTERGLSPLKPDAERGNFVGYFVNNVPCQYRITTAENKKYDLKILSVHKGDNGGVNIEYRQVDGQDDAEVSGIDAEEENLQNKKIFLPDVDEKALMLDLESGDLVDVPKDDTPEKISQALDKLEKGDIVFDTSALILVRGATSPSLPADAAEPFKTYKIGQNLPEVLNIKTRENVEYVVEIKSVDKSGCQLEYYPVHPKQFVSAVPLNALERTFVEQILEMVGQVEEKYPDAATHWPEGPGLYHVDSRGNVTVWHYQKLWHRTNNDCRENEVGYGSSESVKAMGMYYLPDGTPLQSRWRERGSGMKDIRVNVRRKVADGERIGLIHRHDLSSDCDLLSRDGLEKSIVIHSYQNLPLMIAVRIDRPLFLRSRHVGDIDADVKDLDDYDHITLSGPPDRSSSPMYITVMSMEGKVFGKKSDTQFITGQGSERENIRFTQSSSVANTTGQGKTQIVLNTDVFTVNAPRSLISDYLRGNFGISDATRELSETQAAQFKEWIASVPNTKTISSPSAIVFDGQQTKLNVTTQHEFIVDYEKTSDSPPQYKPKRQKFPTGVELELTPNLARNNSIIRLVLKLNQTDLEKVEEKKHESGKIIQLPMRTNSEIATQVAIPVGKYYFVSAAGLYSDDNSSQPNQPFKQTILLIKADIMNDESDKLSASEIPTGLTAQLKHVTEARIKAFNDGDINKMLSFFTDDAILLPDQHEIAVGKDSMRNLYLEYIKGSTKINSANSLEQKLWICGDFLFESGKAAISFTNPADGSQQRDYQNYMTLWSNQPDGSLKIRLDASNPSMVPGGGNIQASAKSVVVDIASGTELTGGNMKAEYIKIRQYENVFHKAFVEQNTNAAAEFYADNAILMPWGKDAVRGKREITEHIGKNMVESPLADIKVDVIHVEGNRRMLYAVNLFTWTFKDASTGQNIVLTGKGVHVWTRQKDGSWKILLDLHNINTPVNGN
ncbi:MAG: DUF4440 domain-containing protein, partial [Sedimentisphaerales bacterium]|nr:DUF4440 domain-containing protein [Sedimentisphaerales bacterium]